MDNRSTFDRIGGWFGISYWTAALVQFVGTFYVFYVVGGEGARGLLHGVAGALCFELIILALNHYGMEQTGRYRWVLCVLSEILISISCAVQISEMQIHQPVGDAANMGGLLSFMRLVVPSVPSVAMAIATMIKFVGSGHSVKAAIETFQAEIARLQSLAIATESLKSEVATLRGSLQSALQEISALQSEREGLQVKLRSAIDGATRLHDELQQAKAALQEARNRPVVQQAFVGVQPAQPVQSKTVNQVPAIAAPISVDDEIVRLFRAGKTGAEIAGELQVSTSKVSRVKSAAIGRGELQS